MRRVLLCAALIALVAAISCAPSVETAVERQRAVDREDGVQLAAQLAALPGAESAQVTLRRAVEDPLAPETAPAAPTAAILIIVDDKADRSAIATAAQQLARGTAPEIAAPQIVVAVGEPRPDITRVGPFAVERGSRRGLIATLAIALLLIAGLALGVASYARRGNSAQ